MMQREPHDDNDEPDDFDDIWTDHGGEGHR